MRRSRVFKAPLAGHDSRLSSAQDRHSAASRAKQPRPFNDLHSRQHDEEVQFYAFDMLASDGDDIRKLPLSMRKTSLARLLARRVDGHLLSDFEQGEIGPDLFRHAPPMGLEGLVSKRADIVADAHPIASRR
ncbi:ATP-dependent DNA ligase [Bradyrhizobium sp. AZCC 1721]|uniref:ATP-dependent DNA ligase n=1 Tax=Bradyrhizobium sp. AZCC 1721 TaxID=3117016 RepID=UPI003FA5E19C